MDATQPRQRWFQIAIRDWIWFAVVLGVLISLYMEKTRHQDVETEIGQEIQQLQVRLEITERENKALKNFVVEQSKPRLILP